MWSFYKEHASQLASVEVGCAEGPEKQPLPRLGGGDGGREGHRVAAPVQLLEQGRVKQRLLVQQHVSLSVDHTHTHTHMHTHTHTHTHKISLYWLIYTPRSNSTHSTIKSNCFIKQADATNTDILKCVGFKPRKYAFRVP